MRLCGLLRGSPVATEQDLPAPRAGVCRRSLDEVLVFARLPEADPGMALCAFTGVERCGVISLFEPRLSLVADVGRDVGGEARKGTSDPRPTELTGVDKVRRSALGTVGTALPQETRHGVLGT